MKKIFVVLLFPTLAILWIVGWVCFVVGKKKEAQPLKNDCLECELYKEAHEKNYVRNRKGLFIKERRGST